MIFTEGKILKMICPSSILFAMELLDMGIYRYTNYICINLNKSEINLIYVILIQLYETIIRIVKTLDKLICIYKNNYHAYLRHPYFCFPINNKCKRINKHNSLFLIPFLTFDEAH